MCRRDKPCEPEEEEYKHINTVARYTHPLLTHKSVEYDKIKAITKAINVVPIPALLYILHFILFYFKTHIVY